MSKVPNTNPAAYQPKTPESTVQIKGSPFKYTIPILGTLFVIIATLIGIKLFLDFQNTTPNPDQPITITYWGLWESEVVVDQILEDFQAQHPHIQVNYQPQSYQDYRERLQNAISQGNGPDVFRFHHTWTPMISSLLEPIPPEIIDPQSYQQTYYPTTSEWLIVDGEPVGIPLMFDSLALYYNQDILQAANLTPPTTWDELRNTAKTLTLSNQNQILRGGIALGTANNVEHFSDIIGLMMLQNAANPALPNNSRGQDTLTFYTLFSRSDRIWDETLPNSTFAFATEKAAMMLAPSWRAHEVADINPQLRFATAPAPQLPDTNINWASYWVEGVSAQSSGQKQAAAWQLLRYLSQKETLRRRYTITSDIPGRIFGEPFPRVDLADQLSADPLVGAHIRQASTAQSWFLSSFTHDNGLNDRIIKYYQDAINAMNQGDSASDALEVAEAGITQVLTQYQLNQ